MSNTRTDFSFYQEEDFSSGADPSGLCITGIRAFLQPLIKRAPLAQNLAGHTALKVRADKALDKVRILL